MDIESVLVAFFGGGSVAAMLKAIQWWIDRRDKRAKENVPNVIEKVHRVYGVLNGLLKDLGAKHAILVKATNGGGIPRVGNHLYTSVIYEMSVGEDPFRADWQNRLLEGPHVAMLAELAEKGNLWLDIEEFAPGELRDAYTSRGLAGSHVYKVLVGEKSFFYLVMTFDKEPEFDAAFRVTASTSVTKIAKLLKR